MKRSPLPHVVSQTIALVLAGFALVVLVPARAQPQEDKNRPPRPGPAVAEDKDKEPKDPKDVISVGGALRKYTGYTRPGAPSDRMGADSQVVEATVNPDDEDAFGGTIYFAVFENQGDKAKLGDTFGTGFKDFDTQ